MNERERITGRNSNQNLEVEDAQIHLDKAGREYYECISSSTPESLIETKRKLEPMHRFNPLAKTVVSVGVGGGEEIHALEELFSQQGTLIVGLDLSRVALAYAQERISKNRLRAQLIQGSGIDIPFKNESVDGIVFSAILHEIYSYTEPKTN